jgi:UDP-glucuronate 4-epimerase
MNVLVTGCHGFVGHNVCKALLAAGHHAVGTDRLDGAISEKSARVRAIADAGLEYVEASLADPGQVDALFAGAKFDCVIHLAAQFPVKHTRQTVDQYIASNVTAFANVLESCRDHGVGRVVYSSSITAKHGARPSSMYAATKQFGELMGHVYTRLGLEIVALRLGAVYGPMMRDDAGIWKVTNSVLDRRPMPKTSAFNGLHEMVFINDVARCMAAFVSADLPSPFVLETLCAPEASANYGHVADIVGEITGLSPIMPVGYRPKPRGPVADCAGIYGLIGDAPTITLRPGLERLVQSIREGKQ